MRILMLAGMIAASIGSASLLPAQQLPSQAEIEGRRSDLARFRAEFLARDRSYSPEHRAEAEARTETLEASIAEVSAAYFDLELARIVALADNGHTSAFAGPRSRRYNRVPFRLSVFGNDFHVLRAAPGYAELLGARLLAIDGRPVAEVVKVARTLTGGTPAFRDRSATFFLESPAQMQALGMAASAEAATYRFETLDGRILEKLVAGAAVTPGRDGSGSGRWLYPAPLEGEGAGWQSLMTTETVAWAFQDFGTPFRWRDMPELGAIVVELRQNHDAASRPIREFLVEMTKEIQARNPRHLIVDMRMNGGGDLNTTRGFFKSLPTLVTGRIFVLTSPSTFSAAISSVGYLEESDPDRVTIVGEMVGDRLEFWAEGPVITLPYTGARVLYATERHDYRTGCRPYSDCHGSVVRNPISVSSLAPDLRAPWTIEAYRAGGDPGMAAIAKALAEAGGR